MMRLTVGVVLLLCAPGISSPAAFGQSSRDGRLIITVVDPSRAVIPSATVTVVGVDDTTKKTVIAPTKTSEKGMVTFERLVVGRYSIQAEFPGFQMGLLRDVRVRSGDNKHVLVLPLEKFATEIIVDPENWTVG